MTSRPPEGDSLEAAQKYEEVFGTTVPEQDERPSHVRAVPKSWEAKPPAPKPKAQSKPKSTTPSGKRRGLPHEQEEPLKLATEVTPKPQVERQTLKSAEMARRQRIARMGDGPARPERRSLGTLLALGVVMLLIIAAGLAFYYRGFIFNTIDEINAENKEPALAATYRLQSEPPGAIVYVDGKKRGKTPIVLELLPDVRYLLELKKKKFATKRAQFEPSVGKGVRDLKFRLSAPATLNITSKPTGGDVWINGIQLRNVKTPAKLHDVPAGEELRVTVKLRSLSVTQNVKVKAKSSRKVHFNLKGR